MSRTTHGLPGVYNSTDLALSDGDGAALALNSKGQIISAVGVGATDLGKAEDAAHTSGDTGVMMLVVRNDTLAALAGTDGDYAPLQVDALGALFMKEAYRAAHEKNDIERSLTEKQWPTVSHITTNTTTTVLSGAATIGKISINKAGASSNTATLYDNTSGSGTVIAIIDTTSARSIDLEGTRVETGLTIVTATGTAPDMTVTGRVD